MKFQCGTKQLNNADIFLRIVSNYDSIRAAFGFGIITLLFVYLIFLGLFFVLYFVCNFFGNVFRACKSITPKELQKSCLLFLLKSVKKM